MTGEAASRVVGLRVDVDTMRGTRIGVPALCHTLARHGVRATFFFSVGPDNMGRHLWRLLHPAFLIKMLRSRAASLYGWDILLRGTLWPGPVIGRRLGPVLRTCVAAGHEIGLHAWDHHQWQARVAGMGKQSVEEVLRRAVVLMTDVGATPTCAAAPAWRCTDAVLETKADRFPELDFSSDCRGSGVFLPEVGDRVLDQPQVPVNLPTYDEIVGHSGVTPSTFNDFMLEQIEAGDYNVLTIHAEVEGIVASSMFDEFLVKARDRGLRMTALSDLVPEDRSQLPVAPVVRGEVTGREGWLAVRGDGSENGAAVL
jgi:undecaprenyl phosphate-alpha-L-ara4FN deformylase